MTKTAYAFLSATLLLGAVAVTSCDDEESLPPIGGYNNADEVGASNLVAYWSFNNDLKESKSGIAPAHQKNNTSVAGIKGNAVSLAEGLLHYPTIAALNSLPSFSVSSWVKVANNGKEPTMIFSLTRPNEWAGAINMMIETGWKKATSDTLNVKCLIVPKVGTDATWQDNRNEPSKGGDQAFKSSASTWFQVVNVWDAATSKLYVYANGKKIDNPEWEYRTFNGNPIGALTFFNPTTVVIGGFLPNVPGNGTPDAWMTGMTGQVDEIRVWNKALAPEDISSLYQLELEGR